MRRTAWLVIGLDSETITEIIELAEDNNIELHVHGTMLPLKNKKAQKRYDCVFLQAKGCDHKDLYQLMAWSTQVSWWKKRGRDASMIIFLPKDEHSAKIISGSFQSGSSQISPAFSHVQTVALSDA